MSLEENPSDENVSETLKNESFPVFEAELAEAVVPIDDVNVSNRPPETAGPEITAVFESQKETPPDEIITADLAVSRESAQFLAPPPVPRSLQNISANGGAVGAMVLGFWCLLGSLLTNWSLINGFLGLVLGLWGLSSQKKKTAWLGITLCVIGILMSTVQVSEMVNAWMNSVDESAEF